MKRKSFLLLSVALLGLMFGMTGRFVFAANLYNVQYLVQPASTSVEADHTITFQSRSAVTASQKIILYLQNLISDTNSVSFDDVDFSYGDTAAGAQTALALAANASGNTWGVEVDSVNKKITMTAGATIPAQKVATIKIGTHTTTPTGTNRLKNALTTTAGGKMVSIVAAGEVGVVSVSLQSNATIGHGNVTVPQPVTQSTQVVTITQTQTQTQTSDSSTSNTQASQTSSTETKTTPSSDTTTTKITTDTTVKAPPSSETTIKTEPTTTTKEPVPTEQPKTEPAKPPPPSDATPPTTSIQLSGTKGNGEWYRSAIAASLSASDNLDLKVSNITYRISGQAEKQYSAPFSVSQEGSITISYFSIDAAGNKESVKTATLKIDSIAPSGSFTLNSGAQYTNSQELNVAAVCADALSGCAGVQVSTDGGQQWGEWKIFSRSFPITFSDNTASGMRQVSIRFRDEAGNESSITTQVITLDTTAPRIDPGLDAVFDLGSEGVLEGLVFDDISGVASLQWERVRAGDPISLLEPNNKKTRVTGSAAGVYEVVLRARDAVGNESAKTTKVQIKDPRLAVQEKKEEQQTTVKKDIRTTQKAEVKKIDVNTDNVISNGETTVKVEENAIDLSKYGIAAARVETVAQSMAAGRAESTLTPGSASPQASSASSEGGAPSSSPSQSEIGAPQTSSAPVAFVSPVSSRSAVDGAPVITFNLQEITCNQASKMVDVDILKNTQGKLLGCVVDKLTAEIDRSALVSAAYPSRVPEQKGFVGFVQRVLARVARLLGKEAVAEAISSSLAIPDYQRVIPITEFEKAPSVTFSYTQKEASSVKEPTIKLYSWNFDEERWVPEPAILDIENNVVVAQVKHFSLFGLFAEPIPLPRNLREEVVYTPAEQIEEVKNDIKELGLKDVGRDKSLKLAGDEFYLAPSAEFEMCIPGSFFYQKPVKRITLTIAGARYPLAYDKLKDCYGTKVKAPAQKGKQEIVVKIIYIDDQVQTIKLKSVITSDFQAALLGAIGPSIIEIQKAAEVVNQKVQETVEVSEPALQTTVAVSVPVVSAANPTVVTSTMQWYHYLNHFITWLLTLLGLRKRRKSWGVVYDAISKNPLDLVVVRLFDTVKNKLIETQVTDKNGRFSFLTQPGAYTVSAAKPSYIYPSRIVQAGSDGEYERIYRNEMITIQKVDEVMSISVPLDPPHPDEKLKVPLLEATKQLVNRYAVVSLAISMIISVALAVYTPSLMNTVLLIANSIFVMSQVILLSYSEKPWGVVFDALTGRAVPLAAIAIVDAKANKLLRTRLTDYVGRFNFLSPPGEYILTVSKESYILAREGTVTTHAYKHLYYGGPLRVARHKEIVKTNIPLLPKEKAPQPDLDTGAKK